MLALFLHVFLFFLPRNLQKRSCCISNEFHNVFFFSESNAGELSPTAIRDYYKHDNRSCQRTYVPFEKGDCKVVKYFEEGTRK